MKTKKESEEFETKVIKNLLPIYKNMDRHAAELVEAATTKGHQSAVTEDAVSAATT